MLDGAYDGFASTEDRCRFSYNSISIISIISIITISIITIITIITISSSSGSSGSNVLEMLAILSFYILLQSAEVIPMSWTPISEQGDYISKPSGSKKSQHHSLQHIFPELSRLIDGDDYMACLQPLEFMTCFISSSLEPPIRMASNTVMKSRSQ
ncbi:hypothetical protein H671_6g16827 [Cricetulus griseus]|nr:hypothetical protein H671_6g16827 [Cricetulus griseus]